MDASATPNGVVQTQPESARPEPAILSREVAILMTSFKKAVIVSGQVVKFSASIQKHRVPQSQTVIPKSLINQLGVEIERYDQACDIIQERLFQAMAVLKRDIDRETARIAKLEESKKPIKKEVETIVLSSDDEDEVKRDVLGGRVDANGVIHLDSDSEDESNRPSLPPKRSSAPGISMSALQPSPAGGLVVDLTMNDDPNPQLPTTHTNDRLIMTPKKRGSVSLRLDLSSEVLRGMPFGADGSLPSPVTLAPKTARPQSAHPSLANDANHFFPVPADPSTITDPSLLPHLLSAIAPQSSQQHDILGSRPGTDVALGILDLPGPSAPSSTHLGSMMDIGMDESSRMDLDLFGEIGDDDGTQANTAMLAGANAANATDGGLGISLGDQNTMEPMSTDPSQPSASDPFPTNSFTATDLSTLSGSENASLALASGDLIAPTGQEGQDATGGTTTDELMQQLGVGGLDTTTTQQDAARTSDNPLVGGESLMSLDTNPTTGDPMSFTGLGIADMTLDVPPMDFSNLTIPDGLFQTDGTGFNLDDLSKMDMSSFEGMDLPDGLADLLGNFNPNPPESDDTGVNGG